MTTVAYRDGVLASDSLFCRADWKIGNAQKVFKSEDGRLIGFCGDLAHCLRLVNWLLIPPANRDSDMPPLDKDTGTVVEVLHDGTARYYEHNHFHPQRDPYWSVGSGAIAALVAMDMGANAIGAVKAAIRRDTTTGGKVQSIRLNRSKEK